MCTLSQLDVDFINNTGRTCYCIRVPYIVKILSSLSSTDELNTLKLCPISARY